MNKLTEIEKNELATNDMRIPLIKHVASKYFNPFGGPSMEDLMDYAEEGYVIALNAYEKDRGAKFTTYAIFLMERNLLLYLKKDTQFYAHTTPLEQPIATLHSGEELLIEDVLADKRVDIARDIEVKDKIECLKQALDCLSDREIYIVCSYYGCYGSERLTQAQIASDLNITQVAVHKALKTIYRKLRDVLVRDFGIFNSK